LKCAVWMLIFRFLDAGLHRHDGKIIHS
jgi:hypothetical protein